MLRLIATTALAALLAPGGSAGQQPAGTALLPDPIAALERQLRADAAADDVGAIAAAVVLGDSVVWAAGFGRVDTAATAADATPETVFRAGSISKSITALLLLALVERGVVALDDPVERHLPEIRRLANFSFHRRPITFGDLATHRAGIAREPGTSHAARGPFREWKRKVVAAIPSTDVVADPGTVQLYSNMGYALLGFALERAAGQPYERLVHDLVLAPLDMRDTWLGIPPAGRERVAAGYVNPAPDTVDARVPRAEHRGRGYRVPSDGFYSTASDLARLAMAMTGALGDVPVSAATRRRALTDGALTDGSGSGNAGDAVAGYGMGFQLFRIGDAALAGHSGTVAGYTSYLAFDPESGAGVVLLRSYTHGATNLGATAIRLLLDLR